MASLRRPWTPTARAPKPAALRPVETANPGTWLIEGVGTLMVKTLKQTKQLRDFLNAFFIATLQVDKGRDTRHLQWFVTTKDYLSMRTCRSRGSEVGDSTAKTPESQQNSYKMVAGEDRIPRDEA